MKAIPCATDLPRTWGKASRGSPGVREVPNPDKGAAGYSTAAAKGAEPAPTFPDGALRAAQLIPGAYGLQLGAQVVMPGHGELSGRYP
jgi:hypothetical protein